MAEENSEDILKEKAKKISIQEGSASSVQDGFGLRYITPYALAIGEKNSHINTYIGFLTSVPILFGNLSQLYSSKLIEKFPRKKIVSIGVFLQALMWLALISVGYLYFVKNWDSDTSLVMLIIFYSILIIFGAFVGPVWVSWMKDLVTKDMGAYFGKRSRICGSIALFSMLIAGLILDVFKETHLFIGFFILFFIAFLFRALSGYLFTRKYEPEIKLEKEYYFTFMQFFKKIFSNNFGRFTVFASLFILSVSIASPFFSVYMLKDLQFSYIQWTIVIMASSISSIIFMPIWGKFSDKYGNLQTIKITGSLITIIPFLWLIVAFLVNSKVFFYIFVIEFFAGAVWGGFNLASANFIYDAVTRQRIALCTAYHNVLNGFGIFIGATFGGFISSLDFNFLALTPILFIFLLSGVTRILFYLVFIPYIKEVREVKKLDIHEGGHYFTKNFKRILESFTLNFMKPRPDQI